MSAPSMQAPAAGKSWPRMRSALRVEPFAEENYLFPSIMISDPVRGKYFKVSWPLSGLLMLWNDAQDPVTLAALMQSHYGTATGEREIAQAAEFLFKNELSETDDKGGWQGYKHAAAASRHSLVKTLMHNYLFFRVPLLRPDAMLRRMLPYLRFTFRPAFWGLIAVLASCGLYLTTRQWSEVAASLQVSALFQQLALYVSALFVLKAIHELGHALTTVHYGCRVPSMGVAFMLGAPMLYTDTSDSWRLTNHRQRLAIVFAGVAAECIVATFALLAWPLLPDGQLRQVCFGFATASIALTLAVNLNPLMRFDGYFALSDYLQVPNLQARSFALASWKLREVLFGLKASPPETFPARKQHTLIVYAYMVWVYRFFLYLGIAYVVYMMAGKAIGIMLGLFELVIFILLPIWRELCTWWKLRAHVSGSSRAAVTASGLGLAALLACTPCLRTIESPGVLVAEQEQEIHLPDAARLKTVAVRQGQQVQAGDLLFEATSPDLDHKLLKSRLEARLLELRLSRLLASSKEYEQTVVLRREFRAAKEKVEGFLREREELRVTAPFSGRIVDLDTALASGTWVAGDQVLAHITSTGRARVKALVADVDLHRITKGSHGVFIADEADLPSQTVVLETIAPASDGKLAEAVLADAHGGPVPSTSGDKTVRAREGWIEVAYVTPDAAPDRLVRGVVRLEAEAQSPLSILWRQIGRVLVREQGF